MIRIFTKPFILLSSKFVLKQLTLAPLNKFITYKPINNVSTGLLFNNQFGFAELPKHKVLNVIVS